MSQLVGLEEMDIGEGVTAQLQGRPYAFCASKEVFSSPLGLSSLSSYFGLQSSPSKMMDRSPSMMTDRSPSMMTDRSAATKQPPSKEADHQVQALSLSRESRSRGNSPSIKDMLTERSSERQLRKSLELGGEEVRSPSPRSSEDRCEEVTDLNSSVELGARVGSPSRVNEALKELLDLRIAELSQKLTGVVADMIDSRVEARLAALESQFADRTSQDYEMTKSISEEICAMGSQMQLLNNRISKISNRPAVRIEHVTALEDRVIVLDSSLSELRCEYLERCLRSHQMEELLFALHSNINDLRAAQQASQGHNSIEAVPCVTEHPPRKRMSFFGASGTASLDQCLGPKGRLETISELPAGEMPEGAQREELEHGDSQKGESEDSPEVVPVSPRDGSATPDRTGGDAIAPELVIEPHTPDIKMADNPDTLGGPPQESFE